MTYDSCPGLEVIDFQNVQVLLRHMLVYDLILNRSSYL